MWDQRVPPLGFFSALCDFFRKFSKFIKGYPLEFFLKFSVCRKRWMSLNGLFLSFSALCDLKNTFFRKKSKIFFWKKFFFPNFSNSCSLNIFEPKIWRRLGTFPSCFLFQLTISLWMVHFLQFVHLFCCSSSTKFLKPESVGSILALNHKFFNASKSTGETKGSPPLGFFFGTMRLFSKIFEIYQRVPLCIFLTFSVCRKRWMSLNGLFLCFSALCDLKNTFFSKKISKIIFLKKK